MEIKAYKFTDTNKKIEDLKDSQIYIAIEQAENGNLKLLKELYKSSFGCDNLLKGYYKLLGWKFDIKKYCKRFLIKYKNSDIFHEYYAPNKTTLYNAFYITKSRIAEIIEI